MNIPGRSWRGMPAIGVCLFSLVFFVVCFSRVYVALLPPLPCCWAWLWGGKHLFKIIPTTISQASPLFLPFLWFLFIHLVSHAKCLPPYLFSVKMHNFHLRAGAGVPETEARDNLRLQLYRGPNDLTILVQEQQLENSDLMDEHWSVCFPSHTHVVPLSCHLRAMYFSLQWHFFCAEGGVQSGFVCFACFFEN